MSDSIRILTAPKTPVRCADLFDVLHAAVAGPTFSTRLEDFFPRLPLASKFLGVEGDLQRLGPTTRLPVSGRAKGLPMRTVRLGSRFHWEMLLEEEFDPRETVDNVR